LIEFLRLKPFGNSYRRISAKDGYCVVCSLSQKRQWRSDGTIRLNFRRRGRLRRRRRHEIRQEAA
jgi:hypothetical protein